MTNLKMVSILPAAVSVLACAFALQGSRDRVVEAESFRLLRDGKVMWEVSGTTGGGVSMKFLDQGKEAYVIVVEKELVGCNVEAAGTKRSMLVGREAFSDIIQMEDAAVGVGCTVRKDKHWSIEHRSFVHRTGVSVSVEPNALIAAANRGDTELVLAAKASDVRVDCGVGGDLELRGKIGRGENLWSIFGKVLKGIDVSWNDKDGGGEWKSK